MYEVFPVSIFVNYNTYYIYSTRFVDGWSTLFYNVYTGQEFFQLNKYKQQVYFNMPYKGGMHPGNVANYFTSLKENLL